MKMIRVKKGGHKVFSLKVVLFVFWENRGRVFSLSTLFFAPQYLGKKANKHIS